MSFSELPAVLSPLLSDRDAIADAIYRSVMALDTADKELFLSSLTEDAVVDVNGKTMNGLDEICKQMYARVTAMDTHHMIVNMRIHIADNGMTAKVMCSALAQHYHGGDGLKSNKPSLLAGSMYWLDVVKDAAAGLWKVKLWKLKPTFGLGDWSVVGQP